MPPPPLRLAVTAGLLGAALLARGKPQGLALVEGTPDGAWRSFFAAVICLPAFLLLRIWALFPEELSGRALAAELIGYVFGWVTLPLVSLALAQTWGRQAAWPRFLSAWNWTSVVQYVLQLALMLPAAAGLLTGGLVQGLSLAVLGYALWLEWFVARAALGVSGARAALLVSMDVAIGLFIAGLVQRLSVG